jgi:hypothetical protein
MVDIDQEDQAIKEEKTDVSVSAVTKRKETGLELKRLRFCAFWDGSFTPLAKIRLTLDAFTVDLAGR